MRTLEGNFELTASLFLAIKFLDQHDSQLVNEVHLFLLQNDGTLD